GDNKFNLLIIVFFLVKQGVITIVILFGAWVALAQNPLTFRVMDKGQTALQGATVVFQGLTKTTDQQGSVVFTDTKPESSELSVRYLGYTPYSRSINPTQQQDLSVMMHPESRMTGEVQVMATRAGDNAATTY